MKLISNKNSIGFTHQSSTSPTLSIKASLTLKITGSCYDLYLLQSQRKSHRLGKATRNSPWKRTSNYLVTTSLQFGVYFTKNKLKEQTIILFLIATPPVWDKAAHQTTYLILGTIDCHNMVTYQTCSIHLVLIDVHQPSILLPPAYSNL